MEDQMKCSQCGCEVKDGKCVGCGCVQSDCTCDCHPKEEQAM